MNHFELKDGVLHAEDVSLPAIADQVGTPFYCYSLSTLQRHYRVFAEAVAQAGNAPPLVAYAVKANPNQAVIAALAAEGAGADVVSLGEMKRALAAGVPADRIVFSGVGKTRAEMDAALAAGIFQFNLESLSEADMLSAAAQAAGRPARAAFRVNPDVDAGTHAKISTGRAENKFGIPIGTARDAFAHARSLGHIDLAGVAVHIGSQLTDLAPLQTAFGHVGALIADLRADGHDIRTADLGGGLGIPYAPGDPEPPLPKAYGEMVQRTAAGWDVRLIFEPGRLITGNAGVLVSRVVRLKQNGERRFVIVDAAMNDLMRPALYDAYHQISAVQPSGETFTADIVGPVCESGDTFAQQRGMDTVDAGDLLVFRTAGAYSATMASTYNTRLLAPEVMVSGTDWSVIRARRSYEELIAADSIPEWIRKR